MWLRGFHLLFVFWGLVPSAAASSHPSCFDIFTNQDLLLDQTLRSNDFYTLRNWKSYREHLRSSESPDLNTLLSSLPKNSLLLDAGAGQAQALRDLLSYPQFSHLRFLAVAFQKPNSPALDKDLSLHRDRLSYIDGGYIENLVHTPALRQQKNKVSFLTDVFGPSAYSRDLNAVLRSYADLLKVDGEAAILFFENSTIFNTTAALGPGRLTLRELSFVIPAVTGGRLEVVSARMQLSESDFPTFSHTVLWLRKVSATDIIRPLDVFQLEEIVHNTPPIRRYLVNYAFSPDVTAHGLRVKDVRNEGRELNRFHIHDEFKVPEN